VTQAAVAGVPLAAGTPRAAKTKKKKKKKKNKSYAFVSWGEAKKGRMAVGA
jgi:hypothetical protein